MSNWIGSDPNNINPTNRFTWFRTRGKLDALPTDATIRFAASTNGQLFINGQPVRRKMSRFAEFDVRSEACRVGHLLRIVWNVIAVLHHHWGPITTFQRNVTTRAGLYVDAPWLIDAKWKWHPANEFVEHTQQITGVTGDHRIRFPIIATPAEREDGVHHPDFDGSAWSDTHDITQGPWPTKMSDVEIAGQREWSVLPAAILAAGKFTDDAAHATTSPANIEPMSIAPGIAKAKLSPSDDARRAAAELIEGRFLELPADAGSGRYVTIDFHQPVHGFPAVSWESASAKITVDLGYGELSRRQFDGYEAVSIDGAIDPEAIVGRGYADRIIITNTAGRFELPDERTARWISLHIRFESAGSIRLRFEMIASQYPVETIGSFHTADARIMQAVALCDIHARVTMVDGYVDCPGREDGLWMEDARLRARIGASYFGDDALRRFQIRIFANHIRDDGNSHPFPPSNYPMDASRDWASQWIGLLYDQYIWSDDATLAKRYWAKVRAMVRLFLRRVDERGVWYEPSITGEIRLPFNPQSDKESSGLITPWLMAMLNEACTLARAIEEDVDARAWSAARERVAKAFREVHVIAKAGALPAYVAAIYAPDDPKRDRGFLQSSQVLPTTLDLLTRDEATAALRFAFDEANLTPAGPVWRWNNPTNFQRSLDALSHVGLHELAWAHFIERFEPFLPGHPRNPILLALQGPLGGPLPEYGITRDDLRLKPGEKNFAQPVDDTGSHGWYATPLVWLHERVLGVTLAVPGGAVVNISPQPGPLPWISGDVATPRGTVHVSVDAVAGKLFVEIPGQVIARIRPPWGLAEEAPIELRGPARRAFERS